METHNTSSHTHTSHTHITHTSHTPPWTSSCYLFHLFPLLVQHFCPFPLPSSTFFFPRTPPPFFFSLSLFSSLFFSLRAAARGEERPQTGSICSIFRALLRPHAHGRRMSRRRNDPTSLYSLYSLTHSLHALATRLLSFFHSEEEFYVLLSVLFFFLALPHIKAPASHSISHFWQCKISVCLAEAEAFPHCSLGFIVLFVFSQAPKLHRSTLRSTEI